MYRVVAALLLLHICCIDPFARDRKYENFTRLCFFSLSHVTDASFAKENRLKTFFNNCEGPQWWVPLCLCLRACLISPIKKKQPSGLFIGSKSQKMANSWHEAALNIKCQGGRCDSQHYTIRLQPLDKLLLMQNVSLQTRQQNFMFQQLNHMFRFFFFFSLNPPASTWKLLIFPPGCRLVWFSSGEIKSCSYNTAQYSSMQQ